MHTRSNHLFSSVRTYTLRITTACLMSLLHSGCGSDVTTSGPTTSQNGNTATTPPAATPTTSTQAGWSGIIGTGQSLSAGYQAPLTAATKAALGGMRLVDNGNTYDITKPSSTTLALVPLTEPFRAAAPTGSTQVAYPANIAGKTPHSAMASQISSLATTAGYASFTTVHSAVGIGGAPMSDINKGGAQNSYAASRYEARALTALAQAQNHKLHYDAVVFTHGEADAGNINTHYEADLVALQTSYAQDLAVITGQNSNYIPLILSQQQTNPVPGAPLSPVIQAQWHASVTNPNTIICAGPKYQYVYAPGLLHLPATGYDRLGEKYAQVFWQTVVNKTPFVPLSPNTATRLDPNTIQVTFHVPIPPLNWDSVLPNAHQTANSAWAQGKGFEVSDPNGQAVQIGSVSIDNSNTSVTLKIVGAPSTALTLNYAMTADVTGWEGGVAGGRIGHLRDSDPLVGASAETLSCQTTAGSPNIVCPQGLAQRAYYDVVSPGNSAIVGLDPNNTTTAVLSAPWTGATGTSSLSFHHEHRNYLVSFTMPVSH